MFKRLAASLIALVTECGSVSALSLSEYKCSQADFDADATAVIKACDTALSDNELSDETRITALKLRGQALQKAGRIEAAAVSYEQALILAPEDADLHVGRGWIAYAERDMHRAFHEVYEAWRFDPTCAEAQDLLKAALAVNGSDFVKAKAAYEEALRLDPNSRKASDLRYQLIQRLVRRRVE